MKYKNGDSYFISNIEKYYAAKGYGGDNSVWTLYFLQEAKKCIQELIREYPDVMEEDRIRELRILRERFSQRNGVSFGECYSYVGSFNGVKQGVRVTDKGEDLFLFDITKTDFSNKDREIPSYQRRMEVLYEREEDLLTLEGIVEFSAIKGEMVRNGFSKKGLRRVKTFLNY